MKITKLEKKKRLYLLETDTGEKCYITEDTIVHFFLSKEKNISPQDFQEIKRFAQLSYGKKLALYFLSFKKRTTKEVREYLEKYEITGAPSLAILGELQAQNWINDQEYAATYIDQAILRGDKGPYLIQQKLQQKGIAKSLISEELSKVDFQQSSQKLAKKIADKYSHRLPTKALKEKIIQQLLSKGFQYPEAKEALHTLTFQDNQELESSLIEKEFDKQIRKYSRKYQGYELNQRLTQALARKGFDFDTIKSFLREKL